MHRHLGLLAALAGAMVLLAAGSARAQVCSATREVGLPRYLRQVYLDLLGRPPTVDEYQATAQKGLLTAADIQALMERDEFYLRMRGYHRAMLRANLVASVFHNLDARLIGTGNPGNPAGGVPADPYAQRGNTSLPFRGGIGVVCEPRILQKDCNAPATFREDPDNEPATKTCYDSNGVPLPVTYDYDPKYYQCTRLDAADATVVSCKTAVTKGVLADKYFYFCDMQRDAAKVLHPWKCAPNPSQPSTAPLTQEILEPSTGRVIAYANPTPASTATFNQLDRCGLTPTLSGNIKGAYTTQRGCLQREGYELKAQKPFWDSTNRPQVALCAYEAQERSSNPVTLESCETARFLADRSCGCGENARRCEFTGTLPGAIQAIDVHQTRLDAFNQEPERIADSVLRRNEPYFSILTTRRSFVNGPLSAIYHQRHGVSVFRTSPPNSLEAIPDLPYSQVDSWVEYTRGPQHSGVLTTPEYLYRFPTARSRVNQFYQAFLCTSFAPPANATLPPPDDACNRENNLAKRCGCNYCHATIEPTGAHWGRFAERAATYLDPLAFPKFQPTCRDCAVAGNTSCGGVCGGYVMRAFDGDGASSLGMLTSYLYRPPGEEANIEAGPAALVQKTLQSGNLERCLVRQMWKEFLGRPMSAEEEALQLAPLGDAFLQSNQNLKVLIQRILATDAYRRID